MNALFQAGLDGCLPVPRNKRFHIGYVLLAISLLFGANVEAVEGRFGQALDCRVNAVEVPHDPAFHRWPLTIGMWVRVLDPGGYSVFIACESKASAAHWELFSQEGKLTLYAPGMTPDHVRTTADLCDGQWHYIAASLRPQGVRMAVDGRTVAEAAVARPENPTARREALIIGCLSDGGLPAKALLDEVVIRKGQADILTVPSKAGEAAADTLACFHFDGDAKTMVGDAASKVRAALLRQHGAPAGEVRPPLAPANTTTTESANLPSLTTATSKRLNIASLGAEDLAPRPALLTHWQNWTHPERIFQWNRDLARPAGRLYDECSLILPQDKDALATVLRRTQAILDLRQRHSPDQHSVRFGERSGGAGSERPDHAQRRLGGTRRRLLRGVRPAPPPGSVRSATFLRPPGLYQPRDVGGHPVDLHR